MGSLISASDKHDGEVCQFLLKADPLYLSYRAIFK